MRIVSQAMRITDWRLEERPRERLLAHGAAALSDAELVAVLLRTGVRGKSAVDLARDLLAQYEGVTRMLEAGAELESIKGLGPAKRAQFTAAIELARRALQEKLKENPALTSPGAVRDYLRLKLAARKEEAFVCMWLDAQHKVIDVEEASRKIAGVLPEPELKVPAEGYAVHPEWQNDPVLCWRSAGNPLLRVLEELQILLDNRARYRGRVR